MSSLSVGLIAKGCESRIGGARNITDFFFVWGSVLSHSVHFGLDSIAV